MKININKPKPKTVKFKDVREGMVFLSGAMAWMKIRQCFTDKPFYALNLELGNFLPFRDTDEVEIAETELIIKK